MRRDSESGQPIIGTMQSLEQPSRRALASCEAEIEDENPQTNGETPQTLGVWVLTGRPVWRSHHILFCGKSGLPTGLASSCTNRPNASLAESALTSSPAFEKRAMNG